MIERKSYDASWKYDSFYLQTQVKRICIIMLNHFNQLFLRRILITITELINRTLMTMLMLMLNGSNRIQCMLSSYIIYIVSVRLLRCTYHIMDIRKTLTLLQYIILAVIQENIIPAHFLYALRNAHLYSFSNFKVSLLPCQW